jgi:hypothetical protein
MTAACSMASFGSCAQVLPGAICRKTMVPVPLAIIASFDGGGLASVTECVCATVFQGFAFGKMGTAETAAEE